MFDLSDYSNSEEIIQRLRQLFIKSDDHENQPPINTHIDFQDRLKSMVDDLWNIEDCLTIFEKYLELYMKR